MASTLAEIIAAVQKLSEADQDKVIASIQALRTFNKGPSVQIDKDTGDEGIMLQAIADILVELGIEHTTAMRLTKATAYKTFHEQFLGLQPWLDKQGLSRNEKRLLMRIGVDMLYRDLSGMGIPIGSRMIMTHIGRLSVVLNAAFPGYAELGVLKLVVRGSHGK